MELPSAFLVALLENEKLYYPMRIVRLGIAKKEARLANNLASFARSNYFSGFEAPSDRSQELLNEEHVLHFGELGRSIRFGKVKGKNGKALDAFSGAIWKIQAGARAIRLGLLAAFAIDGLAPNERYSARDVVARLNPRLLDGDQSEQLERLLVRLGQFYDFSFEERPELSETTPILDRWRGKLWRAHVPDASVEKAISWLSGEEEICAWLGKPIICLEQEHELHIETQNLTSADRQANVADAFVDDFIPNSMLKEPTECETLMADDFLQRESISDNSLKQLDEAEPPFEDNSAIIEEVFHAHLNVQVEDRAEWLSDTYQKRKSTNYKDSDVVVSSVLRGFIKKKSIKARHAIALVLFFGFSMSFRLIQQEKNFQSPISSVEKSTSTAEPLAPPRRSFNHRANSEATVTSNSAYLDRANAFSSHGPAIDSWVVAVPPRYPARKATFLQKCFNLFE